MLTIVENGGSANIIGIMVNKETTIFILLSIDVQETVHFAMASYSPFVSKHCSQPILPTFSVEGVDVLSFATELSFQHSGG